MENKVSVVMPVFNEVKFLKESIESILSQSLTDFEFIILDDGSTDTSIKIIESYKDSRIKLIKSEHRGMVYQFNNGIRAAESSLIARMDSDDVAEKNRLEEQLYFLKHNSDYSIVGSNVLFIDEDSKVVCKKKYPEHHNEIEFMMPVESAVCHPAVMIRSNVFSKYGQYEESYGYASDHKLFLDFVSKGVKFYNLQKILLKYRVRTLRIDQQRVNNANELSYKIGVDYLITIHNKKSSKKEDYDYNYRMGLIEYYRGNIAKSRIYFLKCLHISGKDSLRIVRFLMISILGNKAVKYLRRTKVLTFLSLYINKSFKIDLHQIKPVNVFEK